MIPAAGDTKAGNVQRKHHTQANFRLGGGGHSSGNVTVAMTRMPDLLWTLYITQYQPVMHRQLPAYHLFCIFMSLMFHDKYNIAKYIMFHA